MAEELDIQALEALSAGRRAWVRPGELAEILGINPIAAVLKIEALVTHGYAQWWRWPTGAKVATLTPLGQEVARRRMVESGRAEIPRFAAPAEPDPPVIQHRDPATRAQPPAPSWIDALTGHPNAVSRAWDQPARYRRGAR